jgi:hypothetical protein
LDGFGVDVYWWMLEFFGQEQKEIGYLVERLHDSFWQPFCRLCNKFSDWDHLESRCLSCNPSSA